MRLILVLALFLAVPALAQPADSTRAVAQALVPEVSAYPTSDHIKVDGKLDEPAWAKAGVADKFTQRDPEEGKPVSERTEVRILIGDDALYVGARLFDREPGRVKARLARRDDPVEAD